MKNNYVFLILSILLLSSCENQSFYSDFASDGLVDEIETSSYDLSNDYCNSNSYNSELSSYESNNSVLFEDVLINDLLIDFGGNDVLFSGSTINFNLRIKFDEESSKKYISNDFILFDYDENQLSIKLSTTSRLNSNEFVYVMEIKNAESIIFNVNIAEFSKEFEFSSIEGLIDTSVYFGKRKMNTNVYTITPLYTIEEYEDFCSDIELTSRLNPEEDFFKDYFIVVVPITHSSSTIENKYVNCFTKDGHLFFNFTMLDEKNASFDYYEDLFFIKISNNYQNYDFEKIVVNI